MAEKSPPLPVKGGLFFECASGNNVLRRALREGMRPMPLEAAWPDFVWLYLTIARGVMASTEGISAREGHSKEKESTAMDIPVELPPSKFMAP